MRCPHGPRGWPCPAGCDGKPWRAVPRNIHPRKGPGLQTVHTGGEHAPTKEEADRHWGRKLGSRKLKSITRTKGQNKKLESKSAGEQDEGVCSGGRWGREEASPSARPCPQQFQERTVNREGRHPDNRRGGPRERTGPRRRGCRVAWEEEQRSRNWLNCDAITEY